MDNLKKQLKKNFGSLIKTTKDYWDESKPRTLEVPMCLFTYHKSGTLLMKSVFQELSKVNGLKFIRLWGMQTKIPNYDVILFAHSLIDLDSIKAQFKGIHIIRDPRDIIVSGYLYHKRANENWNTNKDFSLTPPILPPKVDWPIQHRSEDWKISYLKSLKNKSYQENLLSMSQHDGLLFEMNNYGAWTIEDMRKWNYTSREYTRS